MADDLGALLGRAPLGRAVLRGARGERRLADDRRRRRDWLDDAPADRPRLRADRLVRRDGRVGAAARREPSSSPTLLHARAGRAPARRRAGCAARSGATSRSSTARSTTSTSRCCGRPAQGRRRWPPGPTATRALDHLYRGQSNDCYWHGLFGGIYISHMRLATYEHLIAAEDLADTAAGGAATRPSCCDLDLDGHDEVRLGRPGQVVTIDLDEGAGDRRLGHPRGPARARGGAAPAARGLPRDAARPRGRSGRRPRRAEAGATGDGAGLDPRRSSLTKEAGPRRPALVYDPYERRSGLVRFLPPDATADDWATAGPRELGDAVDGAFEVGRTRRSAGSSCAARRRRRRATGGDPRRPRRSTLGGDRRRPVADRRGRGRERRGRADRRAARARVDDHDARWRRQPGGLVRGRRRARHATTARAGRGGRARSPRATTFIGIAIGTTVSEPADGLVGAGRDDLELGGRLRARLPGQRSAALVAARRSRPASARSDTRSRHDRDRRAAASRGRRREPAAARRPRPLLPAVAGRPVHRRRPAGPDRGARSATGTPGSPPSATGRTRSSATYGRISWDLGPTLAGWLAGRRSGRLSRLRRGRWRPARHGPAVPPHDPAALDARRPADRDPLGPARLRMAVRAAAGGRLAAGDRGGPRRPSGCSSTRA